MKRAVVQFTAPSRRLHLDLEEGEPTTILLVGGETEFGDSGLLARHHVVACEASEQAVTRRLNRLRASWLVLSTCRSEDVLFRLFTICREAEAGVKLAVLGPPGDRDRCRRWLRLGAAVYLSSRTSLTRLLDALAAADRCDVAVIERAFAQALGQAQEGDRQTVNVLSAREQEVLALVAEGLSNQQIGDRLFITARTVAFHVSNVLAKLHARNRTHAVEVARLLGL